MAQSEHDTDGNTEHTIERLRSCLPLRLLAIFAKLNREKHTGRLVINYNEGNAISVEERKKPEKLKQ